MKAHLCPDALSRVSQKNPALNLYYLLRTFHLLKMSYKIKTSTAFSTLTIVKFMFVLTLTTRMMMLLIPFGSVSLNTENMIKGNSEKTVVLHFTLRFMRQPSILLRLQEVKLILKRKLET